MSDHKMTDRDYAVAREKFCAEHTLESELSDMGVRLIGEGDERKARCPFHDDKNPSFSVNMKEGVWKCFAGCGSGGVVEFAARRKGVKADDFLTAYFEEHCKGKNGHSKPAPPLDWEACVSEFGEAHQKRLREWRGYSEKFIAHLISRKMIGVCEGNLSFPIFAAGKVIGTHQRLQSGSWITRGGKGSPWVIGDHFNEVILFESQWDAFAFMDVMKWFDFPALSATCSIIITRGSARAKEIKNIFPPTSKVIVWMQNDKPDAHGNVAADNWLADVLSVTRKAFVCRPPLIFKDVNEWYKEGVCSSTDLIESMESAQEQRDPSLPNLPVPLNFDRMVKFDPKNDPDCLMGDRYLCRGGSAILVGGSGLGKSVITFQAAIQFALGEPLLGLEPKRPLRSVILSAEDDEGDLSETLQGVLKGMKIEPGSLKYKAISENVLLFQENTKKGLELIGLAEELVSEHKADLVWLNPLLSYYSGNPSDPEKSAEFCGALSNMQAKTKVCTMLVHHTGKPKDSETTKAWSIDDFSYIGLGSSVWTNWARAILVLQAIKKPANTFVLRFAKRGQRAGIINDAFEKVREIYIQHAEQGLCWVASDFCPSEEENETGGRPSKLSWAKVYDAWDGVDKTHSELKTLLSRVLDISDKTSGRAILKWSGVHIFKTTNDLWKRGER